MKDAVEENLLSTAIAPGLYLFPLPLSDGALQHNWMGEQMRSLLSETRLIFAENERTARRFISSLKLGIKIAEYRIERLDKDTGASEIREFLSLLQVSGIALLMSEAGCPAIADPGAVLVDACHRASVPVHPLVGPSSILLALMASGLSGQAFAFHGYLPIDRKECTSRIRQLELESGREKCTQLFIETPYRNAAIWQCLLESLHPETRLCYAIDITGKSEEIRQKKVAEWRAGPPVNWSKLPAVFLFLAR
jgi:16S rRNA (cytidine1402-2'-O)-methyltransferase